MDPNVKAAVESEAGQAYLTAVARIAREAAAYAAAHPGSATAPVEHSVIYLLPGGMCDRFARQACETAEGLNAGTWPFRAGTAHETEVLLRDKGRQIGGCIVGALGFWGQGAPGHVAIYVGDGMVCENTSSDSRGEPQRAGVKTTPLADVEAAHLDEARWYYAGPIG